MKVYRLVADDAPDYVHWFPTEEEADAYCRDYNDGIDPDEKAEPMRVEELETPTTPDGMCDLVNGIVALVMR
jgi:hypothetical protein